MFPKDFEERLVSRRRMRYAPCPMKIHLIMIDICISKNA